MRILLATALAVALSFTAAPAPASSIDTGPVITEETGAVETTTFPVYFDRFSPDGVHEITGDAVYENVETRTPGATVERGIVEVIGVTVDRMSPRFPISLSGTLLTETSESRAVETTRYDADVSMSHDGADGSTHSGQITFAVTIVEPKNGDTVVLYAGTINHHGTATAAGSFTLDGKRDAVALSIERIAAETGHIHFNDHAAAVASLFDRYGIDYKRLAKKNR